ncbi:class I SAM-dependent methyltransferase [Terrabacter sp. NPDC000476]|uniref:class I SAM-dependent methyltransferase n=1 Tax=Terrabacter sp. NPDC000476 TaxID=3154258 RepID=UPI003324D675
MRADHYDTFARSYAETNESGLFNAHYARPAMLRLAGDVDGRRVLDAGCGTGPLFEDLRARGATVTGFDGSPAMVELARERLGPEADLHVADLSAPLPYPDDAFHDAVVSLVLHYLQDWSAPLAELHRVIRPGGRLLLSVNHPRILEASDPDADYFAVTPYSDVYTFGDGHDVTLTFWHRPLHAMSDAFADAGFRIRVISEPSFDPDTPPELLPPDLGDRTAFICFLFFVLEAE